MNKHIARGNKSMELLGVYHVMIKQVIGGCLWLR